MCAFASLTRFVVLFQFVIVRANSLDAVSKHALECELRGEIIGPLELTGAAVFGGGGIVGSTTTGAVRRDRSGRCCCGCCVWWHSRQECVRRRSHWRNNSSGCGCGHGRWRCRSDSVQRQLECDLRRSERLHRRMLHRRRRGRMVARSTEQSRVRTARGWSEFRVRRCCCSAALLRGVRRFSRQKAPRGCSLRCGRLARATVAAAVTATLSLLPHSRSPPPADASAQRGGEAVRGQRPRKHPRRRESEEGQNNTHREE